MCFFLYIYQKSNLNNINILNHIQKQAHVKKKKKMRGLDAQPLRKISQKDIFCLLSYSYKDV